MPAGLVRQTASQSQSYRSVQHSSHSVAFMGPFFDSVPVLDKYERQK